MFTHTYTSLHTYTHSYVHLRVFTNPPTYSNTNSCIHLYIIMQANIHIHPSSPTYIRLDVPRHIPSHACVYLYTTIYPCIRLETRIHTPTYTHRYAASMWTISINSATNDGKTAGYDESCSSTLASTFSNGKSGYQDAGVVCMGSSSPL